MPDAFRVESAATDGFTLPRPYRWEGKEEPLTITLTTLNSYEDAMSRQGIPSAPGGT